MIEQREEGLAYRKDDFERFPSQPIDEGPENLGKFPYIRIAILTVVIFIVISYALIWHSHSVWYCVYYMPFYAIFPDSLYLPLYLYAGGHILVGILFLIVTKALMSKLRKKSHVFSAIVTVALAIIFIVFMNMDAYKDMNFAVKGKYLTVRCDINTLRSYLYRRSGGGRRIPSRRFDISSVEQTANGRRLFIDMDFYQYRELLKLRQQDSNKIVTVYYLPNSERMLKYE